MVTNISTYDPTLFQGAAWYYVRYRSRYPQELFDQLTARFNLDGHQRLLVSTRHVWTVFSLDATRTGARKTFAITI